MSRPDWIRQSHRWLSIVFTLTVLLNFAARAMHAAEPSPWITYAPLPPLFLMLLSGLWLFALPYMVRRRGRKLA
jgi:cellulose synthase/poly-beta-1,6-N-acetylglucosamine synthase-like glycosyltransferase